MREGQKEERGRGEWHRSARERCRGAMDRTGTEALKIPQEKMGYKGVAGSHDGGWKAERSDELS